MRAWFFVRRRGVNQNNNEQKARWISAIKNEIIKYSGLKYEAWRQSLRINGEKNIARSFRLHRRRLFAASPGVSFSAGNHFRNQARRNQRSITAMVLTCRSLISRSICHVKAP
jgi:hypothetical protein